MNDMEKVIHAWERCKICNMSPIGSEEGHQAYFDCEYTTGLYCRKDMLIDETIELLKEQKQKIDVLEDQNARLIRQKEARFQPEIMRLPKALGSYDPIFAEFRNIVGDGKTFTKWVDAVISMDARHVTITDLYCEETESRKLDFDFNLYNRAFRFWSTKPTDEQRKAVPWETH